MKILLSNDDGYRAAGLLSLYEAVSAIAEAIVVAPRENQSGASNSLTLRQSLNVNYADNGFIYVEGTPADCVHLAINGLLDFRPDMVVAGINHGANMGDDVLYSGTVAAAIEGRFLGLPAIAVSLANRDSEYFQDAAQIVVNLLMKLQDNPLSRDTILNINIPDKPFDQIQGFEATRLGARHQSQPIIEEDSTDAGEIYRIGPPGEEADSGMGTDFYAVGQGKVSITPLQIDMTRHDHLKTIDDWINGLGSGVI